MDTQTQLVKSQAFKAAFQFLKLHYEEQETNELRTLLSGMLIGPSGLTEDANTMYTWSESIAKHHGVSVEEYHDAKQPNHPQATTQDWYSALNHYVRYFSQNSTQFEKILNDLDSTDFSDETKLNSDQSWATWLKCCSEAAEKE